ncbi:hypothetical protein [Azospirillum sp. SYSU D00513]|uniref:hypothetical protein n=1 Tax=Azospirillum sp. SYSU D00513 TaxID=2812561 RepID=UPI001A96CA68|nr:hypothetical protein [Azospirillum sp. SYSU D00513]
MSNTKNNARRHDGAKPAYIGPHRRRKGLTAWAALGVGAAFLGGCSQDLILSERLGGRTGEVAGLVYALPKGQVQLSAQRKMVTKDDVAKAQLAATMAAGAAKTAEERHKAAEKDPNFSREEIDNLKFIFGNLRASAGAAANRAAFLATVVDKFEESITVTALPVIPDPEHRFTANFSHSIARSDDFKLTVSNGLLTTTSVTSADETKAILTSLAGLVGAFVGAPIPSPRAFEFDATKDSDQGINPQQCKEFSYSRSFDPTDRRELSAVLKGLSENDSSFEVEIDGVRCSANGGTDASVCGPTGAVENNVSADAKAKGLFYRAPRSVRISIAPSSDGNPQCPLTGLPTAQSVTVVVPDSTSAFVLPAEGGGFTTATIGHSFKDGMPTTYAVTQPSELLGVASIPVDILKALVSVPTELVRLRVNYDSEANAIIEQRIKEQEQSLTLLKAQRDLEAARAASAPPASP